MKLLLLVTLIISIGMTPAFADEPRNINELCTDRGDGNMDCNVKNLAKTPQVKLCHDSSRLSYTTSGDCSPGYTTKYKHGDYWSSDSIIIEKNWENTDLSLPTPSKGSYAYEKMMADKQFQQKHEPLQQKHEPPQKQFIDQKPKPKLSFWDSFVCWFTKC
jgi:hypothetical protein